MSEALLLAVLLGRGWARSRVLAVVAAEGAAGASPTRAPNVSASEPSHSPQTLVECSMEASSHA